jgi:hypothetical protein
MTPTPMNDDPDKISFLLRFIRPRSTQAWRGRLERVDNGETRHMTSVEGLIDALAANGIELPAKEPSPSLSTRLRRSFRRPKDIH